MEFFNKLLTKNEIIAAYQSGNRLNCMCFIIRKGDL